MVKYNSDEIFAALGNPIRRQMTERLSHVQRLSLSELAQPFSISLPAALKHVGILEKSGVIICSKEGRVKYCAANLEALEEGFNWFRAQEKFWEGSLDRLGKHLKSTKK
ncbi:MAG: metalloregulator ArsR/SmtB family transcription factor [Candidatus Paceibacterota bacterium]